MNSDTLGEVSLNHEHMLLQRGNAAALYCMLFKVHEDELVVTSFSMYIVYLGFYLQEMQNLHCSRTLLFCAQSSCDKLLNFSLLNVLL